MLAINSQDDNSGTIIPIELFCAIDILLYAIGLGKEVIVGLWCTYCKLMKPDCKINGHERGDLWTINKIAIGYFSQARVSMGVKTTSVSNKFPSHVSSHPS